MYKTVKGQEGHRLEVMYTTIHSKRKGKKIEIKRLKSETGQNMLKYRGSILRNMLTQT